MTDDPDVRKASKDRDPVPRQGPWRRQLRDVLPKAVKVSTFLYVMWALVFVVTLSLKNGLTVSPETVSLISWGLGIGIVIVVTAFAYYSSASPTASPAVWRGCVPRPRIVMSLQVDSRSGAVRVVIENRGDADAFDILVEAIEFPDAKILPDKTPYLKTNAPGIIVTCSSEDREGNRSALFDRILSEALASAIRQRLDRRSLSEVNALTEPGGVYRQRIVVRYRDHDGTRFENSFSVRYSWVLSRFESIELEFVD
jgi:hypothetical protein